MKYKIFKGKYAFCGLFWPILGLSVVPFIKHGFTGLLGAQILINALLILLAFSDIAVRRIPHAYSLSLLVLGILRALYMNVLFKHVLYGVLLFLVTELANRTLNNLRKKRGTYGGIHTGGGGDTKLYSLAGLLLGYDGMMAIVIACILQILWFLPQKRRARKLFLGPFWSIAVYCFMVLY